MDRLLTSLDAPAPAASRPGWASVLALAFALVAFSTACDSGTQEPEAPAPPPAAATTDAGESTPGTAPSTGSIAADRFPQELPEGMAAEIPSNLPSTLPIYPGSEPAVGKGAQRPDGLQVAGVQLLSNDDVGQVFSYYEGELKANGWEVTEANNQGPLASISATRGDAKAMFLIAASPKGGSDIFVVSEE